MSWKDLSYWLKGGIIASIICVLFFLVSFCFYISANTNPLNEAIWAFFFFFLSTYPTYFLLMGIIAKTRTFEILLIFVAGIINLFIIGALIGWIVGKVKEKK